MKRVLALLVGAGISVGGGAAAWAGTNGPRGAHREAVQACRAEVRAALPDGDKAAAKEAAKACLEAAGFGGHAPTPEQQATRDSAKSCLEAAKSAGGDDRATVKAAAKACLEEAGVSPRRLRARFGAGRECLTEARAANPDADRAAVRGLVKDCLAAR